MKQLSGYQGRPKIIVDQSKEEFCICCHMRLAHIDTIQEGHGYCIVKGCQCNRFTWAGIGNPLESQKYVKHPDEITTKEWKKIDQSVAEVGRKKKKEKTEK